MKALAQRLFPLLLFLAWALPGWGQSMPLDVVEVRILPEAVVYGETYQLGEIAEFDGFDLEAIERLSKLTIGQSPIPGKSHLVALSQIQAKLKSLLDEKRFRLSAPKRPVIHRASLKVTKEQLKEVVIKEIKAKYKEYDDVKIQLQTRLKDIYIPKGEASYAIERIGKNNRIGGQGSWNLSLLLDGKEVKKLLIRAKVEVIDEVLVAKDKIKKGEQIEEEDLVTVKKNISKERVGFQPEEDLVVGKAARRDIHPNESLKPNLVEQPRILEKGQPVELYYRTANIYLSNTAITMQGGREGDIIPVRTLDNKKTIYAIIRSSKRVEVAL